MLTLQITGIKSKTKDNTGYYVRSPIQEATPANFTTTTLTTTTLKRNYSVVCNRYST